MRLNRALLPCDIRSFARMLIRCRFEIGQKNGSAALTLFKSQSDPAVLNMCSSSDRHDEHGWPC